MEKEFSDDKERLLKDQATPPKKPDDRSDDLRARARSAQAWSDYCQAMRQGSKGPKPAAKSAIDPMERPLGPNRDPRTQPVMAGKS